MRAAIYRNSFACLIAGLAEDKLVISVCGFVLFQVGNKHVWLCSLSESQMEGSVYDPFDPFDYMYSTSETVNSDPVYAAVDKSTKSPAVSPAVPPPLPPRNSSAWNTIERRKSSISRRVRILFIRLV